MHVDPDAFSTVGTPTRCLRASFLGDTKYDPSASASSLKIGK
jgi:hypothetical protein